jgi:hypothetical protein
VRAVPVLAALVALLVAGCTSSSGGTSNQAGGTTAGGSASASPTPTGPKKGSGAPVHVRSFENDGNTYGVGMPVILYLSKKITDASVFDEVAKVTVNGQDAGGAWYFEPSSVSDEALEVHYRPAQYWPAHAQIHVDLPVKGLWAGEGLVFDNNLTLDINTGAAQLATVDGAAKTMTITSDGQPVKTLEVSLGAADLPRHRRRHGQVQPGGDEERSGRDAGLRRPGPVVGAHHRQRRVRPRRLVERPDRLGEHLARLHEPQAGRRRVVLRLVADRRPGELRQHRHEHRHPGDRRLGRLERGLGHLAEGRAGSGRSVRCTPSVRTARSRERSSPASSGRAASVERHEPGRLVQSESCSSTVPPSRSERMTAATTPSAGPARQSSPHAVHSTGVRPSSAVAHRVPLLSTP